MIHHSKQGQQGMTLMELMIALMLGLFLSAAIVTLFVSAKRSYMVNESMARLQENGRFALAFLTYDTRMADYSVDPGAIRGSDPDTLSGSNNSGLNSSDTVTLVYEEIEAGNVVENTYSYSIQNGKNGIHSLFRNLNGGNAVEVAEGIENIQILYGEDTNGDYVPDHYVDWTGVADRAKVVALKFTVTARTLSENIASEGGKLTRNFSSTVVVRNRLP